MRVGHEPVPYGDPANPLGTRWIAWFRDGVKTSYGFHGTTDPASVGNASSDGCVRFYNEDVERLFDILPVGAPIRVRG
jgi:lipoprotein-anchoring transpeptidase ErfK/SrfK